MTAPDDLTVEAGAPAPPRWRRWTAIGAAVVVALVLTAIGFFRWGSADAPRPATAASPAPSRTAPPTTAEIYAALAPSVVTVQSLDPATSKVQETGSGVIANADGVILTALHVVKGARAIRVVFADGTPSAASVVAAEPAVDIAALSTATLPAVVVPAVLGGRISVGDSVVAIGNPLGLTSSATAGVVSGLDRRAAGKGGVTLSGLIQFDAAVNPGSSGGPLVNARGEAVGIVVALANPTQAGTFIGIGFAVPIGTAVAGGGSRAPQQ
jgi:S1-C subfamily serine protease